MPVCSTSVACVVGRPALAQLQNLDEQLRTTPIRPEKLADNFYVLFGVGGNIVASIGEDGVLFVDDQFQQMAPKYKATLGELGGGKIDFVIEHALAFRPLGRQSGPRAEGTRIVAQENSRQMMTKKNVIDLVSQRARSAAYPAAALPVITYDRDMRMHFNGERIDLFHFGPAHTTGDSAVIFAVTTSYTSATCTTTRLSVRRRRQRR